MARVRRLLTIAVATVLLAACGSGVVGGPDGDDTPAGSGSSSPDDGSSDGNGNGNGGDGDGDGNGNGNGDGGDGDGDGDGTDDGGEEDGYGWGLPEGPYTPDDTFEDDVYVPLAAEDCEAAQAKLDEFWALLKSPRGVLLYQASVSICSGEREAGRQAFEQAGGYGWDGVDWVAFGGFRYDCEVYRSVRSVLDQRAREEVTCSGGSSPSWPSADRSVPRDDPRTPEDESTPTETPTAAPTETPPETPPETPDTSTESLTPEPSPPEPADG